MSIFKEQQMSQPEHKILLPRCRVALLLFATLFRLRFLLSIFYLPEFVREAHRKILVGIPSLTHRAKIAGAHITDLVGIGIKWVCRREG